MAEHRLTGRQITTMVVAACVAILAYPVGSFATTAITSVSITNDTTQTVPLYSSTISPSNGSAVKVRTAGYRTIRVSVNNNQGTEAPLYIYSSNNPNDTQTTIKSYLYNGSITNTTFRTFTFDVPGSYTWVATFGGTLQVQIFGRP